MISYFKILVFILLLSTVAFAQDSNTMDHFGTAGEIIIRFETPAPGLLSKISRVISIDEVTKNTTTAYACRDGFRSFLEYDLPFTVIDEEADPDDFTMLSHVEPDNNRSWDFYPTYEAYLDLMNQFAADHPQLCEAFSIGQSVQGRELMMVRISANVAVREPEPQFLYTGTIHGDELVGYVLLLRLADYLLNNYGIDPQITYLLDNSEIWINPLANPDGTFRGGNHTVAFSTRFNANNVDLNRNYPDPEDGPHPDGKAWQPETIAFMQLAEDNNFVMSANTHGGAEVINYPWDTWSRLAADDDWWVFVSRQYADTVHQYASPTYLRGFNNGITNGYAWYSISGGRQDYMNYFHHCREVTMELSNVKKLAASHLNNHWEWNYRSLINYYEQCLYGISGLVTDAANGSPVAAKIEIAGHDTDNSFVFADSATGYYRRMLEAGTYNLSFSAPGYEPQTINGLAVTRYTDLDLDVQLSTGTLTAGFESSEHIVATGTGIDFFDVSTGNPNQWIWDFEGAATETSSQANPAGIIYPDAGAFSVALTVKNNAGHIAEKVVPHAVKVAPAFNMAGQTLEVVNALFFDAGGPEGNYGNNENIITTFKPAYPGEKISAEFFAFNVEAHSTCNYDKLLAFDGEDISAPLLGQWCGSELPEKIFATNATGAITFQFISDASVTNPGWKALIQSERLQKVYLTQGWSSLALSIQPEPTDVVSLFAPISDNLILLSGNNGFYLPGQDINSLFNVSLREGYLIKMAASDSLTVSGFRDPYLTLELKAGWNLFPVISDCNLPAGALDLALQDEYLVIKEIAGTAVYWPSKLVYSLINLEGGKAYLLYVDADNEFTFPDCD
jgi:PKD repeat protein